ncbi:MAG TPA: hypothetical protein VGM90_16540 [Kofleriaceae bacterium]
MTPHRLRIDETHERLAIEYRHGAPFIAGLCAVVTYALALAYALGDPHAVTIVAGIGTAIVGSALSWRKRLALSATELRVSRWFLPDRRTPTARLRICSESGVAVLLDTRSKLLLQHLLDERLAGRISEHLLPGAVPQLPVARARLSPSRKRLKQ